MHALQTVEARLGEVEGGGEGGGEELEAAADQQLPEEAGHHHAGEEADLHTFPTLSVVC